MTKLVHCSVRYRLQGERKTALHIANLKFDGAGEMRNNDIAITVEQRENCLVALLSAQRTITLEAVRFEFDHSFSNTQRVLFNGYQSWTDTSELQPRATMRGLEGTPNVAVEHFALYGGGDYTFVDYENRPGFLHGWTYCYFSEQDRYELIGSLDETAGFTLLGMNERENMVYACPEVPLEELEAGATCTLMRLGFYCAANLDDAFDAWFADQGVYALPAPRLSGYSSWYRHYDAIDEGKLLRDLYGMGRAYEQLEAAGTEPVFQIDDGFAKVGDWLAYDEKKFPSGMDTLVRAISSAGYVPGLWLAPFVCELKSDLFSYCPDWLLTDDDGGLVATGSHWSGGYALDTLNPDVRDYVREVIQTVTQQWGFKLLKLDFLYAACMVPHGGMNRGQLMADAIDLLREAAGPDVLLLGCGVPLASVFGKFEYCRIGCDVGLDWNDMPHRRLLHRERVSTCRSLFNTVYRAPLNGRAFACDPDVLLLRDDVKLSAEQRQLLIEADGCFGGMVLTSDDMGSWTPEQIAQYQQALDLLQAARHS